MSIQHLTQWPECPQERAQLCQQWNALTQDAEWASPFQCFEWQDAWWQSFGNVHELQLLLVYDQHQQLVAIAPLMVAEDRKWGIRRRRLMLIGTLNHASDYADLIVRRGHGGARDVIFDWILAHASRWTEIEWRNLPAASRTLDALDSSSALPNALVQFAAEAPTRLLNDRAADLRTANKKSLRRHVNGFSREGRLEWQRLRSAEEIGQHLDAFFEQHVARWAAAATPSLFADPAQRAFYRRLAASLGPAGLLHFSVVLFAGRAISYHFGFEQNGIFIWYKPSYDPSIERRSPGEVMLKFLLDDAIMRGLTEFDFTVGSEVFKMRFANEVRKVFRLRVYQRAWERVPALGRDALKRLAGREKPPMTVVADAAEAPQPQPSAPCV